MIGGNIRFRRRKHKELRGRGTGSGVHIWFLESKNEVASYVESSGIRLIIDSNSSDIHAICVPSYTGVIRDPTGARRDDVNKRESLPATERGRVSAGFDGHVNIPISIDEVSPSSAVRALKLL